MSAPAKPRAARPKKAAPEPAVDTEAADAAPPDGEPPEPQEHAVTIEVGGHVVAVRTSASLDAARTTALEVYQATKLDASRIPFGFAVGGAHIERADPYEPPAKPDGDTLDRRHVH